MSQPCVIELSGRPIVFHLRRSRLCRSIRLSVHPGGRVTVSAHPRVSLSKIQRCVSERAEWLTTHIDQQKLRPVPFLARSTPALYREHRASAEQSIQERVDRWNAIYKFRIRGIRIRDMRTRWGSCSSRGWLSFSYKVAFLPEGLADYIVVHELCHLAEMNHSRAFWKLVEQTIIDAKVRRRQLRGFTG